MPSADPIFVGNVDQPGNAAQQHFLIGIDDTVRISDFPQHLDQLDSLAGTHALDGETRKRIILMGLLRGFFGLHEQVARFLLRKLKFFREQPFDGGAFRLVETIVHARRFNEEHGNSGMQVIAVRDIRLR